MVVNSTGQWINALDDTLLRMAEGTAQVVPAATGSEGGWLEGGGFFYRGGKYVHRTLSRWKMVDKRSKDGRRVGGDEETTPTRWICALLLLVAFRVRRHLFMLTCCFVLGFVLGGMMTSRVNHRYYYMAGSGCCYCAGGGGAMVFVADHPLGDWKFQTNINAGAYLPFGP